MKERFCITLEDDDALLEERMPAIVPVVISSGRRGVEAELYFNIYPEVSDFIYEKRDVLFEDETLKELNDLVSPYLFKKGYVREKQGTLRWYHSFAGYDKRKIDLSLVQSSTKKLSPRHKNNETSFDLDELREYNLPAFVTVIDKTVVSIATVNPYSEGQRMLEITAETAPQYRKNGYAASNVAALASYLLRNRHTVAYCCSRYNRASIKIARSVGLVHEGKFYAIDAYSKETMEGMEGEEG
ncbi:MAG: GNAT family N-acetyltransferase [Ruminococcaceae bacterium]|nr:GNAT family N-acetyltransferase [Oscillospiraceae bacterium]